MFFWPYVCWLDCKAQKKRKFCHKLFINSFNVKDCMNASNGRGHAAQKTIQNTVTIWYVYTFWKISRKKTTKLSRWMFTMQYRTTLTDKRKTNDKRETNNKKKLPFKLWIFYTVSNGIQSIERHLHDIIMKWKFQ